MAFNFNVSPGEIDELEASGQISPNTAAQAREQIAPALPTFDAPSIAMPPSGSTLADLTQIPPGANIQSGIATHPAASPTLPQRDETGIVQPPSVPPMEDASRELSSATEPQFEPSPVAPAPPQGPNRIAGITSGYGKIEKGIQDAALTGAQKASEEAGYIETHRQNLEKMAASEAKREADRQSFMDKEISEQKTLEDKILGQTIDPNRFWNSRSTGQKVTAVLSIILGGVGAGMTKSNTNGAYEILQGAIDRDIDAQKSETQKLKDISSAKKNMYGMFLEKFKDERQADAAAKIAALNNVELQLKTTAAKFKAPELQAQADKAIGELQVQKNAALLQFEQATKAKQAILASGQTMPAGMDVESLSKEQRERYIPGMGLALSPEGAKVVREVKVAHDNVSEGLANLESFANASGDGINPAKRGEAQTEVATLIGNLRLMVVGPGAMTAEERKIIEGIVANPTDLMSFDAVSKAKLGTLKKIVSRNLTNTAKANMDKYQSGQQKVQSFTPR